MNWLEFTLGAAAATALCFLLHTVDVGYIEKNNSMALTAQINNDAAACNLDKQTTKEANDDLQKSSTEQLNSLAAIGLQHPACYNLLSAGKAQPTASGSGSAEANGISSRWLKAYSITSCKRYYNERIILEKFIDDERKPHQ